MKSLIWAIIVSVVGLVGLFGARVPKPVSEARANLETSIATIPKRYRDGVERADWETGAASDQAESNFAEGVSEAVATKSRQSGVRKAGNQKWMDAAITKGAAVIGERVRGSLDAYERNFGQVYDQVLRTVATLPPRTRDSMANIDQRVKPVVQAFKDAALKGK